jgi:hypothetical protein
MESSGSIVSQGNGLLLILSIFGLQDAGQLARHFGLQQVRKCKAFALHLICFAPVDLRGAMQTKHFLS